MKKTIHWGIIGCGGIAHKFARSARVCEGVEIIAAASRTKGKARVFAAEHKIEAVYTDYTSLLRNQDVEAVYVATTHNYHYENVKQILEAGKHVLCEKPMTVNGREMRALKTLAAEKNLFMMEAMWTRFLPSMVYVRDLLDQRVIGEIKQLRATFGFKFPFDPDHRLFNPDLAGGAMLDAGIYPLSFANMVMKDKPAEVKAIAEIGSTGVDEQSIYIFRYKSGALAMLNATVNAPVVSRAEIIGTSGRITIPDKFLGAEEVWLDSEGGETVKKKFDFDEESSFQFEIEAASQSIRDGLLENEIMPVSDTQQLIETIDEIKEQLGLVYANDNKEI